MEINHSAAFRKFKKEIGQANHMLITIMVGLDGIVPYEVEPSEEFHTSWNPQSKKTSVDRSKKFVKKACLAWLVDCVDMYLRLINQSPSIIAQENVKRLLDERENSRSVYRRTKDICEYYQIQPVLWAMMDLLICWRNRVTHFQAENDISAANREALIRQRELIYGKHCGLDIAVTLQSFDNSGLPTFKEITSFVRASIQCVEELDQKLLADIDRVDFADRVIVHYMKNGNSNRIDNVFSKDQQTIEKTLRQILFQNGFAPGEANEVDQYCARMSALKYSEVKQRLENRTLIV